MSFDQGEEIAGCVPGQRGFDKMGTATGEVLRCGGSDIGKIAPPAAGDEDLVADSFLVLENSDAEASLTSKSGAKKTGGSAANHDHIPVANGLASHDWIWANWGCCGRRANTRS